MKGVRGNKKRAFTLVELLIVLSVEKRIFKYSKKFYRNYRKYNTYYNTINSNEYKY